MNILDIMQQEEQKAVQSGRFGDLFYTKDSARIRFLVDFQYGSGVYWHKDFENEIDNPCHTQFGMECPFCMESEKKIRNNRPVFIWPTYDYDREKPLIFFARDHEKTIVGKLKQYWQTKKSILGRDFYITRSGEKLNTTYSVVPEDPSRFEFAAKYNVIGREKELQRVVAATLILARDPIMAEQLGYSDADRLCNFFESSPPPKSNPVVKKQVVSRPKKAGDENDIEYEDEE